MLMEFDATTENFVSEGLYGENAYDYNWNTCII